MPEENEPNDLPVSNTPLFAANEKITKINVADEIKNSFLDYSMSVIISRALPDVRQNLRTNFGRLPPSRRGGDLSHAHPHGATVGHARATRRWQGQLRLRR